MLKAAIVGIGQVGICFDLEPKRVLSGEIWTHFSAYERLSDRIELIAVVDPEPARHAIALSRKPEIKAFFDLDSMFEEVTPDLVSICTPDHYHLSCLESILERAKGIFLEKPICLPEEIQTARNLVRRAKELRRHIYVNYYKRRETSVRRVYREVIGEKIGMVTARYSGPFLAVGSHALDLLSFFLGPCNLLCVHRHPADEGDGYDAVLKNQQGSIGYLQYVGERHNLVFELDLFTDKGKYEIRDNCASYSVFRYVPSSRYEGYNEISLVGLEHKMASSERFVGFLKGLADDLQGDEPDYTNLDRSMLTQELITLITKGDNLG